MYIYIVNSMSTNTNMKRLSAKLFGIVLFGILLLFQECSKKTTEPTPKQITEDILMSKAWVVSSVTVPVNSATQSSDWANFTARFEGSMTTAGHAAGAEAVWPSGTYTVSEDGKSISRGDGIEMMLTNVTESGFTSTFVIVNEEIDQGRIASLDGEYIFNMR